MATLEQRYWNGDFSGPTRRDRQPCEYEVYVPDKLRGLRFSLDGDVAADVADAEAALTRLDASAVALADSEALARLLLRAEKDVFRLRRFHKSSSSTGIVRRRAASHDRRGT